MKNNDLNQLLYVDEIGIDGKEKYVDVFYQIEE